MRRVKQNMASFFLCFTVQYLQTSHEFSVAIRLVLVFGNHLETSLCFPEKKNNSRSTKYNKYIDDVMPSANLQFLVFLELTRDIFNEAWHHSLLLGLIRIQTRLVQWCGEALCGVGGTEVLTVETSWTTRSLVKHTFKVNCWIIYSK